MTSSSSVLGTYPLRTRILVLPWTTTRWVVFPFIIKDLLVDENPVDFDADGHPSWMQLANEPVNLMLIALVIWMTIHTA